MLFSKTMPTSSLLASNWPPRNLPCHPQFSSLVLNLSRAPFAQAQHVFYDWLFELLPHRLEGLACRFFSQSALPKAESKGPIGVKLPTLPLILQVLVELTQPQMIPCICNIGFQHMWQLGDRSKTYHVRIPNSPYGSAQIYCQTLIAYLQTFFQLLLYSVCVRINNLFLVGKILF